MMSENNPADRQNPLQALQTFFEEDGWFPQPIQDLPVLRCAYMGKHSQYQTYAYIHDELSQFIFYVFAPEKIPAEVRVAMGEFIIRVNYGMRIGNFEMDYEDGELRFKSSLDFENSQLTPALIHNVIYPAVQTMDRYFPGIQNILSAQQTPRQACEQMENPVSETGS